MNFDLEDDVIEIKKAQQAWLQVLNNPAATDAEYMATRATFKALRRAEMSQLLAVGRVLPECAEAQAVDSSKRVDRNAAMCLQ